MSETTQGTDPIEIFRYEAPICVQNDSNLREHWSKKHSRSTEQAWFVKKSFQQHPDLDIQKHLPVRILLTRLYPRFLDAHDNLPISFKKIADEIAFHIFSDHKKVDFFRKKRKSGADDRNPMLKWEYAQEKSNLHGARIQIFKMS